MWGIANGDGAFLENLQIGTAGGPGAANDANTIAGNTQGGIHLNVGCSYSVIGGNYIGTNAEGDTGLGNGFDGICLSGSHNYIGYENVIAANGNAGIDIAGDHNTIAGNYVGTDDNDTAGLGNAAIGIAVTGNWNYIGTDEDGAGDPDEGNVISGNATQYNSAALRIDGDNNVVAGNLIGTNTTGTAALANHHDGIEVSGNSNRIGTDGLGSFYTYEGNVISGNGGNAIYVVAGSQSTVIAGNRIGTNATGTTALGNGSHGILVEGESTRIGSNGDGNGDYAEWNLISGNTGDGIHVSADGCTIAGNQIGTNAMATATLANGGSGIYVDAADTLIGYGGGIHAAEEANTISGNTGSGIRIDTWFAENTVIAGNYIGTNTAGTADLGNGGSGISIELGAYLTQVGSDVDGQDDAAEKNTIAYNAADGVTIASTAGSRNRVSRNAIYNNDDLGIDIAETGILLNDALDSDTGPNYRQNYPQITSVVHEGGNTKIQVYFNSLPNTAGYRIELYGNDSSTDSQWYVHGREYLGCKTGFTTNAAGEYWFETTITGVKWNITATATDADGNTSESAASGSISKWTPTATTSWSLRMKRARTSGSREMSRPQDTARSCCPTPTTMTMMDCPTTGPAAILTTVGETRRRLRQSIRRSITPMMWRISANSRSADGRPDSAGQSLADLDGREPGGIGRVLLRHRRRTN